MGVMFLEPSTPPSHIPPTPKKAQIRSGEPFMKPCMPVSENHWSQYRPQNSHALSFRRPIYQNSHMRLCLGLGGVWLEVVLDSKSTGSKVQALMGPGLRSPGRLHFSLITNTLPTPNNKYPTHYYILCILYDMSHIIYCILYKRANVLGTILFYRWFGVFIGRGKDCQAPQ